MLSLSPTVVFMIVAEMLVAVALLAGVFYFITTTLKKKLSSEESKLKASKKALDRERLPETTREKIKHYLQEQKQLTIKKIKNQEPDELSEQQVELLEMRKSILDFEFESVSTYDLDEGFWESIFEQYNSVRPDPEIVTVTEEVEVEAVEEESVSPDVGGSLFDTKSEELDHLHGVVGSQYNSIDELKRHIRDIEEEEPNFSEYPFVIDMKERLKVMEMEQEQMAMCVQVMENENERLMAMLAQHESDDDAPVNGDTLDKMQGDSIAVKTIVEKLQKADNMIRNLIYNNKDQLKIIAELEDDNESLRQLKLSSTSDPNDHAPEEMQQSAELAKQLTQTNKEHLQCITILESEVDALQQLIVAKDVALNTYLGNENSVVSEHSANQDTEELYAKIAELDLLQADYDSMKQKYLKLFQQSKAS